MNSHSSMDRTARWVQTHAQQGYHQQHSLSSSQHRARLRRQDTPSSQQSSRTDLGAPDHGVGTGGPTRGKPSSTVLGVAGSSLSSQRAFDEPLPPTHHQRSRSHSNSIPHDSHPHPRLNIPVSLYRNPNLPAFVQGPPGSGYPMTMTPAPPPTPHHSRVTIRGSPSPPIQVPAPLNPKKSRPTVQKRRPSLSGATFDPPAFPSTAFPSSTFQPHSYENRDPRVQGQGDVRRVRGRAASESRRR